jgi:hypothetical protein
MTATLHDAAPPRTADFAIAALYSALDAERQARGLSWAQRAREIGAR